MKKFILSVFLLLFITSAYADPQLQSFVNTYLSQNQSVEYISTVAMTLQCNDKNGHLILDSAYSGSLGFGNNSIEQKKTSEENLFQIGSITKSFISVVLLQLEADSKYNFNIDDSVGKWFPEEKYANWKNIKVRQLLDMTSGIPAYTSDPQFLVDLQSDPYRYLSLEEILNYVNSKALEFTPGSKYEYSNTNYTLAGLLVERITNNSIENEVKIRIIDKLNLSHTFFPINFATDVYAYEKLVHGYSMQNYFPKKTDITHFSLSWANSAGAIISNTIDINKYVHALFTPGQILTATQIEKLETPEAGIVIEDNDGITVYYGLGVLKVHNKKTNDDFYNYQGSTLGFRFTYIYFPQRSLNIVFAVNSAVESDNSNEFMFNKILTDVWQSKCY